MPSEIMGPEPNPDPLACLLDHGPDSFVTDLTHSHAATGHQFQHETVSQFRRRKNDLIDDVFLDNFPGNHGPQPKHLPEHRAVARAPEIRVDVGSDKIEEA